MQRSGRIWIRRACIFVTPFFNIAWKVSVRMMNASFYRFKMRQRAICAILDQYTFLSSPVNCCYVNSFTPIILWKFIYVRPCRNLNSQVSNFQLRECLNAIDRLLRSVGRTTRVYHNTSNLLLYLPEKHRCIRIFLYKPGTKSRFDKLNGVGSGMGWNHRINTYLAFAQVCKPYFLHSIVPHVVTTSGVEYFLPEAINSLHSREC